jgi:type II secretory pathway pseudopilin PulG
MAFSLATHRPLSIRLPRRLSGEEGLGLIELMVAMVLMVIGVLAAFLSFETSQRADGRAERTAAVSHHAQSEIEKISAMNYTEVGMETIPTNSGSGNAQDPLNYVVNSPAGYKYDWSQPATSEPFVNGGKLLPSSNWTDGNRSGKIYRFVTWVSDACPSCAKSQDYKRVTIVLTTPGSAAPFIDSTFVTK